MVSCPLSDLIEIKSFQVEFNDILLVMVGATTGKLGVVKNKNLPALLNQNIWNLKPKNKIDKEYLRYKSYMILESYLAVAQGSAREFLKQSDFLKYTTKYHICKLEQQKIAKVLSTIDSQIEQNQALIEKYTAIKQGLMADLFSRGIDVKTGKLRSSYQQAPELYWESDLGWIPKDWGCSILKRLVKSAEYGISTSLNEDSTGIPVLRMNNIKNNEFNVSDLKYSKEQAAYSIRLKKGDVLYNRTNSMEHVGKAAIWKGELDKCSFASYLVRINLNEELLLSQYFAYWMSLESSQSSIRVFATPAVQQVNISPTSLQKVLIACPKCVDEQKLIVKEIKQITLTISAEEALIKKLKIEKQGLMQDLLTGKKSVDSLPDSILNSSSLSNKITQ
jgi:type I restriction enzyme S subunit